MRIAIFFVFTITLLLACQTTDKPVLISPKTDSHKIKINDTIKATQDWVFDRVDKQQLVFKNGKVFDTHLFELTYIGQVTATNKAPYLIFSGRDCDECDANISLYVHSPDDGKLVVEMGQNRLQYPGKEKDIESDTLLYQSRVFFGEVLPNTKGVIWYEKRLLENNTWDNDIFLINLSNSKRKDTMFNNTGQMQQTLSLLKLSKCKEIIGKDYTSEP